MWQLSHTQAISRFSNVLLHQITRQPGKRAYNSIDWGEDYRMSANILSRVLLPMLIAGGLIWAFATPAQAQLAAGCACPAGYARLTSTTCFNVVTTAFSPAICPGRNIGQIATAAQEQSLWGINQMLQAKRDQLQATPVPRGTNSQISGYVSSSFDDGASAPPSANSGQTNNPLANLYDATPAAASASPTWGTWLQGMGDWEHDDPLAATDVAHFTSTYTAQGGLDRTQQGIFSSDDALVLGIVSSWTQAHTEFSGSSTVTDMSGPGVGVYSEYVKGGFSTDVTTKFDFLQIHENFQGAAPNQSIDLTNEAVSGNAQYKFTGLLGSNNNFIEPTVGFTLSHTSFANAGANNLQDAYTVKLQAGARIGTTWDLGQGVSVDADLKALAYGDAIAQGTSIAGATDPTTPFNTPLSPTDTGLIRGELDPELCFNLPYNYSLTLSGQVRYGQALVGGSAGVNLRRSW